LVARSRPLNYPMTMQRIVRRPANYPIFGDLLYRGRSTGSTVSCSCEINVCMRPPLPLPAPSNIHWSNCNNNNSVRKLQQKHLTNLTKKKHPKSKRPSPTIWSYKCWFKMVKTRNRVRAIVYECQLEYTPRNRVVTTVS
jgi:hypothetical protein